MAVPLSEPVNSGKASSGTGRASSPSSSSTEPANVTEALLLSSLKDLVSSGEHRLDTMLAAIADAARRVTGASGAALAMWKEGSMVCRARSGQTAPPLGAKLSAETGISGECLRAGKVQHCVDTENSPLVDVEVCRSLGLRSIAVIPIQGWRGINGILEVFATTPGAFSEHHLAVLDQLAALAERARATQPHGASPVGAQAPPEMPRPAGILPASDRVRDVVRAFMGGQSQPVVLGAIGVAAVLLVALVIWLGWRGSGESDGKAHAAAPAVPAIFQPTAGRIPDNDPVWKPNPGGVALLPNGKTSAGTPVKLASKIDVIEGTKAQEDRSLLAADAARVALPHVSGASGAALDASTPGRTNGDASKVVEVEAPVIGAEQTDSSALNQVLMAKATVPGFTAAVSQGVSGGKLIHRVSPTYPAQAKLQRVEGKVVLSALVREDGGVSDLKIMGGNPALAQSAMEAVKQWRFEPFMLNGKAIQRETTITIDFKLPSAGR